MKIGVCQVAIHEGDYELNIKKVDDILKERAAQKVDILCFPELVITGFDFDVVSKNIVDEKKLFSDLAKKYKQCIFAGVATYENKKFYDVAAIWDKEGLEVCIYKKIHLWGEERNFFSNGDEVKIFEMNGWRIGTMICADLGFAEITKIMSLKGCDAVLCPTAWSYPFQDMMKLMSKARACENQMYVITINRADSNNGFCGNSIICNPMGEVLIESNVFNNDYIEADIHLEEVKKGKLSIPWLKMRLPEVYNKNEKEE